MSWQEEIKRCLRSLLIHRLRTLLSTLGVLFGVVAVIAMLSIGEGAKQETLEQIEQLGVNSIIIRQSNLSEEQHRQAREKRSQGLTQADANALEKGIPTITILAPLKAIEASLTGTLKEMAPEILGVTRTYGEMKGLKLAEGRFICDTDIKNKQLVCVLGYGVSKGLGKEGHVGHSLRIENVQYQIVGVLKSTHWKESKNNLVTTRNLDKSVFIALGTEKSLPRRLNLKQETLSEIILKMKNHQQAGITAQIIKNILDHHHGGHEDYQIIIPQELLEQAYRTQGTFNLVLGSIAAISLLVGGIGIMNIMLATVSERTREIGIRRAVGANKWHIMTQFLLETLILTLIGAVLGVIIGICCSYLISYVAGWQTIVTPWSIILSLGMSVGVGLCSGLYPAFKAASLNPILALRHE
jgi:putative ABC transport system permease protein